MQIRVNLESESYQRLLALAKRRGRSIEDFAGEIIEEHMPVAESPALGATAESYRWSYSGRPWNTIPKNERAEIEKQNYAAQPFTDDEIAVRPEDEPDVNQEEF